MNYLIEKKNEHVQNLAFSVRMTARMTLAVKSNRCTVQDSQKTKIEPKEGEILFIRHVCLHHKSLFGDIYSFLKRVP